MREKDRENKDKSRIGKVLKGWSQRAKIAPGARYEGKGVVLNRKTRSRKQEV